MSLAVRLIDAKSNCFVGKQTDEDVVEPVSYVHTFTLLQMISSQLNYFANKFTDRLILYLMLYIHTITYNAVYELPHGFCADILHAKYSRA